MGNKLAEKVLYGLEHFGVPTRDWSLQEAQELVSQGLLSQEEVDKACKRYQAKIDDESLRKYGTTTPTKKQKLDHALNLLETLRKEIENAELPDNFVKMYSGKYSSGKELRTSGLGGCMTTLLYFESQKPSEGIMTHYPPLNVDENIQKLRELKDEHLKGHYEKGKGVILVERLNETSQILEAGLRVLFPEIVLDTVVYDQNRIGMVSLNPSQSEWRTEQHGRNAF